MKTEKEEHSELIILWSGPWWVYMLLRGGFLRAVVNAIEDILAITGRTLLLVFLIYCGIKSGALLVTPDWHAPDWLEMLMFALQLAGLEGSIPGLARHAQALRTNKDEESANKAEGVMTAARWMTILSIGEGVLHLIGMDPMLLKWISGILLLARGVVITGFLIELAKLDAKGPRILSQQEHDQEREQAAQESEQTRTIADLRKVLSEAQAALHAARGQAEGRERDDAGEIARLHTQLASLEEAHSLMMSSADGQARTITDLHTRLSNAEGRVQEVSALLSQSEEKYRGLLKEKTAQRVKIQSESTYENSESRSLSQLVKAPDVKAKITSIENARVKVKSGDTEILAYMAAYPGVRIPDVAAHFQVTVRTIYNVLKRAGAAQESEESADAQ